MGDQAVKFLIEADDHASEKFQTFYSSLNDADKLTLQLATDTKGLAGQMIELGEALGLTNLDGFSQNLAEAIDITSLAAIDLRNTGKISGEVRLQMMKLAFTVGKELGKSFMETALETKKWTQALKDAEEAAESLEKQSMSRLTQRADRFELDKIIENKRKELEELKKEAANPSGAVGVRERWIANMFVSGEEAQKKADALQAELEQLSVLSSEKAVEAVKAEQAEEAAKQKSIAASKEWVRAKEDQFKMVNMNARQREIQGVLASEHREQEKQAALVAVNLKHDELDKIEKTKQAEKEAAKAKRIQDQLDKKAAAERKKAAQEKERELQREAKLYNSLTISVAELTKGKEAANALKFKQEGLDPASAKAMARVSSLIDEVKELEQDQKSRRATDPNKFKGDRFGTGRTEAEARRRDAQSLENLAKERNTKLSELTTLQTQLIESLTNNKFVITKLGD